MYELGGAGVSGNRQGGVRDARQFDGDSDMAPACAEWVKGLEKEQWHLPALLSGRAAPQAITLKPDNSVPLGMSLQLFKLLLGLRVSESISD